MHPARSMGTTARIAVAIATVTATGCSLAVDTTVLDNAPLDAGRQSALPPGSDRCQPVGPFGEPGVVAIGSILPTVEFSSIGVPMQNALEMAIVEINEAGGLGDGRRLALAACDSSGSRSQGMEVARYLVDRVGVPLIIGPAFSGIFIDVSTQITVPAGVMTLSPSATSPLIGGLDDNGLAWRTAASDEFQGIAIADLVRARNFPRVIALGKADAYGRGLLSRVNESLGTQLTEETYFSAEYDDPGSTESPDFATPILDSLQRIRNPRVILLLGTNEVADLMRLFETRFELSGTATASRPRYIFADGGKVPETLMEVEMAESLIDRIEGTEPDHQSPVLYDRFLLSFRQRFRAAPGIFTTNSYDAAYLAAYSIMTVPGNTPTGQQLANGMSRLVGGMETVDAGPDGVSQARMLLTGMESIDFNGVSGRLDFDLTTGEAPANVSLWKIGRRTDGTIRFDPRPAGSYTIGADGRGMWTLMP